MVKVVEIRISVSIHESVTCYQKALPLSSSGLQGITVPGSTIAESVSEAV